jgi:hypothetical protein
LRDSLLEVLDGDREELLTRVRLSFSDPDIRAHAMDEQLRNSDEVAKVLARHVGRKPDDLEVACAAAAIIAISMTVMRSWVAADGKPDLGELYDNYLGLLDNGLPF